MKVSVALSFVLSSCLAAFAMPARAAQSYDGCAGFIDSVPATITTQGVWCLRRDLSTAITSGAAITIAVNNVTIDCNDFKLGGLAAGNGSRADGIHTQDRQNMTVRNCNIRGFYNGVRAEAGAGHLVEDNRFDNNLRQAILMYGGNNRIRRNAVYDTGGAAGANSAFGIYAFADIEDNIVSHLYADGINTYVYGIYGLGAGTVVRGNRVYGLVVAGNGEAVGLVGAFGVRVSDNHVTNGVPTPGVGISGIGTNATFCSGNTVMRFAIPLDACHDGGGNIAL